MQRIRTLPTVAWVMAALTAPSSTGCSKTSDPGETAYASSREGPGDEEPAGPCPAGADLREERTAGGPVVRMCRRPDGVLHGDYTVTWPGGVITAEGRYRDGKEVGRWTFRHVSGALWKQGDYLDGQLHGTWSTHDLDGELLGTFTMDRGTGTEVRWWDSGTVRQKVEMRAGRAHGVTTWWLEGGEKVMEAHYRDGRIHGTWTFWDPQGRTRKVEQWHEGVLGETTWFDPSSQETDE